MPCYLICNYMNIKEKINWLREGNFKKMQYATLIIYPYDIK